MVVVSRLMLFVGLMAILALVACDPCRTLADKICECEESNTARENCRRSIDMFSQMKNFDRASKTETCREILNSESCNCLAIRNGLIENCGMTR